MTSAATEAKTPELLMGGPLTTFTLGALIGQLGFLPDDKPVRLDCGGNPGRVDSYRGFYDNLAIQPDPRRQTVAGLRGVLCAAVGEVFTGYKGGGYVMTEETPLWVSPWGEASGLRVCGVVHRLNDVVIRTIQWDGY